MIIGHVPAVCLPPDHAASCVARLARREETSKTAEILLLRILHAYEIHHNQHRPYRSLDAATPLKPLPEPVDLNRYRVRRQTHTGCLINEYRLVA
jgi:hypothetical protein